MNDLRIRPAYELADSGDDGEEFMHFSPILAPVVALVAWTLIVMVWMLIAAFAEFRGRDQLGNIPVGSRGVDLEGRADRAPVEIAQLQPFDGAADDLLCDRLALA